MITRIAGADRGRWAELWTAYLTFYNTGVPPEVYDSTWARLLADDTIHGLAWREDGRMVGLVHYLFHAHAWSTQPACYLQDLFVRPASRGAGAGRALIEAVATAARAGGAARLYWMTHESNAAARRMYDRVAQHSGFIRYEFAL